MFISFKQAASKLAATILAPDAPMVASIAPAFNPGDTVGTRDRLRGSIGRAPGLVPVYYLFPDNPSGLNAGSKKLHVSTDGDPSSGADITENAFQALNIDSVIFGILRTSGGADDLKMTVGGVAGATAVTLSPVTSSPFTSITATVGTGAPQVITIQQAIGLVGATWLPWTGASRQPPTIPVQAGIPTLIAADATAADLDIYLGVGPARTMRDASLALVLPTPQTDCAHTASLIAGITGCDISRPLSVALAAIKPPATPGDGPILIAARAASTPFFTSLLAAIDFIPGHHAAIIAANHNLAAHGITIGFAEAGRHIGQAMQDAEGKAPAIAPLDPVAAAIAAACAAITTPPTLPDPVVTEARRLLSGAAGLDSAQMDTAVAAITQRLRSSGFIPPPPHLPPGGIYGSSSGFVPPPPHLPPVGSYALAPLPPHFAGLVIPGAESLSPTQVIHSIAVAFGKTDAELTTAISTAAGKPPTDAFFTGDHDGLATQAAADWRIIISKAAHVDPDAGNWSTPPSSWLEAGRRLRAAADSARDASARTKAMPSSKATDDADRTAIPKSSGSGAKGRWNSASGAIIGCLTAAPVVDAEAIATRLADPFAEARRIRDTSYGGPAITFMLSDGTVSGSMPNKCAPHTSIPSFISTHSSKNPYPLSPWSEAPPWHSPFSRQTPPNLPPSTPLRHPPAPSHPPHPSLISSHLISPISSHPSHLSPPHLISSITSSPLFVSPHRHVHRRGT